MSSFEERLSAYLGGDMDAAARKNFEAEVLADASKSEELASMTNLDRALREAMAAPARVRELRSWWRVAAPLAAAAVLVALVWTWGDFGLRSGAEPPVLRGDREQMRTLAPEGVLPAGTDGIAWNRAPEAAQYRVEFWLPDGTALGTVLTADTTLVAGQPGFPELPPGGMIWQVTPILPDGREGRPSGLVPYGP